MSRTINRSVARKIYAEFSRNWRADLRRSGLYGKARSPKRPSFNQWYHMHLKDTSMMRESTPQDVAEFLQPGIDPWTEQKSPARVAEEQSERGVMTIQMVGSSDDE